MSQSSGEEDVDIEDQHSNKNEEEEFQEITESESDPEEFDHDDGDIDVDDSEYIDKCPVNISHFDLLKVLGSGAYGTVFLVQKNCGTDVDKIYALKVISKAEAMKQAKTINHMRAERTSLELVRTCPYIQKLYYAFQTADKLFLVTEFLPGGELFMLVQKGTLPEEKVRFYIAELIVALEHIHLQGIVYRDIKLENVMIDKDGHVKLVDFGLCKKLGVRGRTKSFCGTEEYMAPEVIACTGHNSAADWWALGVLTIELLSGISPFGTDDGTEAVMHRISNEEPVMPSNISEQMEDFLMQILVKDPRERLGGSGALATQIKQHPLFSDIDWTKLEKKQLLPPSVPTLEGPFDTQHFDEKFTDQLPIYKPSEVPENSFRSFKGYSYIAPELNVPVADRSFDENRNSDGVSVLDILSNSDPESKFHEKYRFLSHKPLGVGKSSVCMKCVDLKDNRKVYAVKIYKRQDQNYNEIDVLKKAAENCTPGVLRLIDVLTDSKWSYLVMEFIDGSNLLEYLSTVGKKKSAFVQAYVGIWRIIESIHELNYTHGCICFKSIYCLQSSREYRLISFRNAKPISKEEDKQMDFWSLGVCLYTMLCGHSPFNTSMPNLIQNNHFDQDSEQWKGLHKNTQRSIGKLLRNVTINDVEAEFKRIKFQSFDRFNLSPEQIDENKNIVEIRGRMGHCLSIKTEVTNEIEVVTNGNAVSDTKYNYHSQHIIPEESRTNGHIVKTNSKRRNHLTDDKAPKNKKRKNDNVKSEIIQSLEVDGEIPQRRILRTRDPVNYGQQPKTTKELRKKPPVEEFKNDVVLLTKLEANVTPKTEDASPRRGRPKKEPAGVKLKRKKKQSPTIRETAAPSVPPRPVTFRQPPPQVAETNSTNTDEVKPSTNSVAVQTDFVFILPQSRPKKPQKYCFERIDYT